MSLDVVPLNQLEWATLLPWLLAQGWPLLLAAACAGWVDSMGGGGGLITVPTLLTMGVPAPLLLGTNKCLSTIGSLPAVVRYARAGLLPHMHRGTWALFFLAAALAAAGGAWLSQQEFILSHLHFLVPSLLFTVMAFMLKRWFWDESPRHRHRHRPRPGVDKEELIHKKLRRPQAFLPILAVATYDGVFGPGTGTFFLTLFERLGLKTLSANATTKIFNLASNIGALLWFSSQGKVIWILGGTAAGFYLGGNYLGAGLVLKRGHKLIRGVVLLATTALLVKHLSRYF